MRRIFRCDNCGCVLRGMYSQTLDHIVFLVRSFSVSGFIGELNSQRAQEVQVLCGEWAGAGRFRLILFHRVRFRLVQPDGGFQHEHHFKPLGSDIANNAGDLIGFCNGVVDGFPKLLNEIAYLAIQVQPPRGRWSRFPYHTLLSARGQRTRRGCYTFSVVEYVNLGRKLGIGTRVAAKILRERAQKASSSAPTKAPAVEVQEPTRSEPRQTARPRRQTDPRVATRNVTRGVARGSVGFGRGVWKPFAHAFRALWHEVTGVFFAIFALFFAQSLWRVRGDWQSGPQHHRFAACLIFMLVFAYFSIMAFVHSRRTQQ
jgi:hypothetical protein